MFIKLLQCIKKIQVRNTLIKRTFNTPLGIISCELNSNFKHIKSNKTGTYEKGIYEIFQTSAHNIELIEFKVKQPFNSRETIMDSKCWIWRIEKVKEIPEIFEIKVGIMDFLKNSEFDFASGENLDAFGVTLKIKGS